MVLHRTLVIAVIAFAILAASSRVLADSEAPPFSYKKVSPGGAFVFVMIAPLALDVEFRQGWNEKTTAGIRDIRRVYSKSGLYRNDGSPEPLWTVDWYAYGVEIASDGISLIRHGPWASSTEQEALNFFANGKLLRTYLISELVDVPTLLPGSVSHFRWSKEMRLGDSTMEYTVVTMDGNRFVFDARTGGVVSETRLGRRITWGAVIIGAILLIALVWFVARRRGRWLAHR
jgi:hypothetical protein